VLCSSFFEAVVLSGLIWKKPVICIFKQRNPFEIDPFVVVKAKLISVSKSDSGEFSGKIQDFFTLMGDADYLSTKEGVNDKFVMCWFDDTEPDMKKDLRRLRGVTFSPTVTCIIDDAGKRTYNASFKAEQAKLK
jgi:hypothetical protein